MTKVAIITGLVIVMSGVVYNLYNNDEVILNEKTATTTEAVISVEEVDVIDSAQAELDRINKELDSEETKLLEDIKLKEEQHKLEVDAIKERIEKIQETRASFRSPRGHTD